MSTSFGLHFGSTSACIAVSKDGKSDVVANDAGDRVTPAIVAFTDHDQVAGLPAKQGLVRNVRNTVCNVKQVLGRKFDSPVVQDVKATSAVKILDKAGEPVYEVDYKEKRAQFTPIQIAATIFKNVKDTAESHGGLADSHDAVIAVPDDFETDQQQALVKAATKGGFTVLRTIKEPCAALLAYDIGQAELSSQPCTVLVFRLGGSSLSVSIVRVVSGMYNIVASTMSKTLGGHCLDEILLKHFAEEFNRLWKCECREKARSVTKLRTAAQNARHILSTLPTAHCSVDSLHDGIDYNSSLSRSRLEALSSSWLQKCLGSVEEVLSKASLTKADIHNVIVCGGCGKMPAIQQLLRSNFPSAELLSSIPPDEVIALGAGKQASLLDGQSPDEAKINAENTELPCVAKTIYIQMPGEGGANQYQPLLPAFTPIPVRRQNRLHLAPDQTSACLTICQETEMGSQPSPVAKLVLRSLPPGSQVEVVLHVRLDGTLHITCTEPTSNTSTSVTLEMETKQKPETAQ